MKFGGALRAMRNGKTVGIAGNSGIWYRIFNNDLHAITSDGRFLFKPSLGGRHLLSEDWVVKKDCQYSC